MAIEFHCSNCGQVVPRLKQKGESDIRCQGRIEVDMRCPDCGRSIERLVLPEEFLKGSQ